MTRPKRLYKDKSDKYYYLNKGKKIFVKIPETATAKQIQNVNIKNIFPIPEPRRIKKKRKKTGLTYQKKIDKNMKQILPSYYSFTPELSAKPIQEQFIKNIEKTKDVTTKLLTDIFGTVYKSYLAIKDDTDKKASVQAKLPSPAVEAGMPGFTFGRQDFTNLSEADKKLVVEKGKIVQSGTVTPQEEEEPIKIAGRVLKPSLDPIPRKERKSDKGLMPSLNTKVEKGNPSSFSAVSTRDSSGGIEKSDAELSREEARKIISGKGVDDGLYSDEIETIAKKRLKYFVPVIANDQTQDLMKYVKKGDKEFAFVINTDDSGEKGRHWRCVYIDNRDDYKTVEWYDPLTEMAIPENVRNICKQISMKMNPEFLFKFKSNAIRQQSTTSSRCGIHCIHFLEQRHHGIPFSQASGYDNFINELKSKNVDIDGSVIGEKELQKKASIYSSYI
jgi:hypothetical protein